MATDLARLSYDEARRYTGVVPQQGRVSLEAEQNEQRVIDAEERRKELLDLVGPAATPDNGYLVTVAGGELTVGAGIMYVGGLRLELPAPVDLNAQPDWLDRPDTDAEEAGNHQVLLVVEERDVTAIEDPMLFEPALGGPDGAARTRLLQRIELLATDAATCSGAVGEDTKQWPAPGVTFDPDTMRLESNTRLLVTWQGDPEPPNPCEPSAVGGYLGAENQLIRVQVAAVDDATGTFDVLWGYDGASMLYRVTPDTSADPILTLERSPVDDYHRPAAGKPVQVLRATAALAAIDATVEGYVAALDGQVAVLPVHYDPDTKSVQLPAPLPPEYLDTAHTPQLYLRTWEQLITGKQVGDTIDLSGTGLRITLSLEDGGPPQIGDYWCIAVRPATPTTVYPDRLLRTPQPPDGPRRWACPLAVVSWQQEQLVVLDDCRHHFPVPGDGAGGGCCTVEVSASDAPRLQDIIDNAARGRIHGDHATAVVICFEPGRYTLPAPIVLRKGHSNITLRACAHGAVVSAADDAREAFGQGLIVLAGADNVTITGVEFELPQIPAAIAKVNSVPKSVFAGAVVKAINAEFANRYVSIAIRAIDCAVLEVADCLFRFSIGEHQLAPEHPTDTPRNVFGVGIFVAGGAWGLRLRRNSFRHHAVPPIDDQGDRRLLVGYLLAPAATARIAPDRAAPAERLTAALGTAQLPALFDDVEIIDNTFDGLTAAALVVASIGAVRVRDNSVRNCYGGIWLADAAAVAETDLTGTLDAAQRSQYVVAAHSALVDGLLDPVLVAILLFAETFPLPSLPDWAPAGIRHVNPEDLTAQRKAAAAQRRTWTAKLMDAITAGQPAAAEAAAAPAAEPAGPPTAPVGLTKTMATAWAGVNELQQLAAAEPTLDAVLRIESNDIACTTLSSDCMSGPPLFLFLPGWLRGRGNNVGDTSSAIVANNRALMEQPRIGVVVLGMGIATVTGNIVVAKVSADDPPPALAVLVTTNMTITGNAITGVALIPQNRPFPAPLDSWLPFNSITS